MWYLNFIRRFLEAGAEVSCELDGVSGAARGDADDAGGRTPAAGLRDGGQPGVQASFSGHQGANLPLLAGL